MASKLTTIAIRPSDSLRQGQKEEGRRKARDALGRESETKGAGYEGLVQTNGRNEREREGATDRSRNAGERWL